MLKDPAYTPRGCFKDDKPRALTYLGIRVTAVEQCYAQAKKRGYDIFAVQNGDECWVQLPSDQHDKYGNAKNCYDGKGGVMTNNVYQIGNIKHFCK